MRADQKELLPKSVRYIKNGTGGAWWKAAKSRNELHAGWSEVPAEMLVNRDIREVKEYVERLHAQRSGNRIAAANDLKALQTLLDRPSQHIWVTFEDRKLWWCTVNDEISANDENESEREGHFWLTCNRNWSDHSLGGRLLAISSLPGTVTKVAGFRATICEPKHWDAILRVIFDEEAPCVAVARQTRMAYQNSIAALINELQPYDFEQFVDILLSRDGWVRISELGKTQADVDIEVENRTANEIAFVQIKGEAGQSVFNDYVGRFQEQQDRYAKMIFAVHRKIGNFSTTNKSIQIWDRDKLASLAIRVGLGEWLESKI